MKKHESWGRFPKIPQEAKEVTLPLNLTELEPESTKLPFGNGRSYGDVCLTSEGLLLSTRQLDCFMEFDRSLGTVTCQSGVQLWEILELCVPTRWILPVTPGTQFVTVGGALANDVHGKNHHLAGTFGRHILEFELARSDGQRLICSRTQNAELFHATIGGLGLTGLVTWIKIKLTTIPGNSVNVEHIKFSNLHEYFELADQSNSKYQYTVAWVDCTAAGKQLGRGIFSRGNDCSQVLEDRKSVSWNVPIESPIPLVNSFTLRLFNQVYANKQISKHKSEIVSYWPFFYPLDSIRNWNRVYGRNGFLQYQCVIPEREREFMAEILERVSSSRTGSALSVLKTCGNLASPGLMSFPMEGTSLALDFPYRGVETIKLFDELDEHVKSVGGRIYPAKDAHTSAKNFQVMYPSWHELERLRDPKFQSDFWRRVSEEV